jgi:hypothetical protein
MPALWWEGKDSVMSDFSVEQIKELERACEAALKRSVIIDSDRWLSVNPKTILGLIARNAELELQLSEARAETARAVDTLVEVHNQVLADFRTRTANAFPTSWLDSLLTGPNAVIGKPPYGCPDIEKLLQAVKQRIESL